METRSEKKAVALDDSALDEVAGGVRIAPCDDTPEGGLWPGLEKATEGGLWPGLEKSAEGGLWPGLEKSEI